MVERRYTSYPSRDGLSSVSRKYVSVRLDMPDAPKVRGNDGDYRVWIPPELLQVVWARGAAGWSVESVLVSGVPRPKYGGLVFQAFDVDGPRVPAWIPLLIEALWPVDEEVLSEWEMFPG